MALVLGEEKSANPNPRTIRPAMRSVRLVVGVRKVNVNIPMVEIAIPSDASIWGSNLSENLPAIGEKIAMSTINELDEIENVLNKIRHNVRIDMRNIRLEYLNKMKGAEEQPQGLFKRKKSTNKIIKEKKSLLKDKDLKIAAYEVVENEINYYLSQIESSRVYIKNSIQGRVG